MAIGLPLHFVICLQPTAALAYPLAQFCVWGCVSAVGVWGGGGCYSLCFIRCIFHLLSFKVHLPFIYLYYYIYILFKAKKNEYPYFKYFKTRLRLMIIPICMYVCMYVCIIEKLVKCSLFEFVFEIYEIYLDRGSKQTNK